MQIELATLSTPPGLPALTVAQGGALAEAASYCLADRGHRATVALGITGKIRASSTLVSLEVDDQISRTHHDLQEATENGACAIAILLSLQLTDLTIVRRSRKGLGFDYWLGLPNSFLQESARLEVSGILEAKGTNTVESRVRQKKNQVKRSDGLQLPAYVCIVEFSTPTAYFEQS